MSERDNNPLSPEEQAELSHGDNPLSEEIARRWDPRRLLRVLDDRAGRGERLDVTTRARFERRLGVDLSDVRVYTGGFAESVTKAHSAEAVTVGGTGMILMSGTPDRSPATAAGRALLAHELTHVAQSKRGIHRAAAPGASRPLATEEHEREAEAAEADELNDSDGAEAMEAEANREKQQEAQDQAVLVRVLELFEEDERLWVERNGDRRYRP